MATSAIRTAGLTKEFGDLVAVDDLDLDIPAGEIFGFLGPNGAGKSTTIRLLLGFLRPTAGQAWVSGVPVQDVERAHASLSYVPGDVVLWPQLTGTETLHLLAQVSGRTDPRYRDELVDRFELDLGRQVRTYSKGNRQKLALVAAFMSRPDVLLLDEPTVGLDPLMQAEFQALAREAAAGGQTVFLSSHLLDEVEDLCTRVGILRSGRLVEVSTLDQLRGRATAILEARFSAAAPTFEDLPEVVSVDAMPGGLRITVAGAQTRVLQRLAAAGVTRIDSHAPTLEQTFLTFYDTTTAQREAVAAAHGRTRPRGADGTP